MRNAIRKILLLAALLFLLALSGCWNRREPDSLALVDSLINDAEGEKVYLTFEVLDPSPKQSKGSGGQTGTFSSIYVSGTGYTLPEALRSGTNALDRKLYIGHIEARFLSERLAKAGIAKMIDFYLRDHEARQDPYMVVIKGENPGLLYSCASGMSDNMGTYITKLASNQMASTSESVFVRTLAFLKAYYDDGIQPVAGTVEIIENPDYASASAENPEEKSGEKYLLEYKGLAAFKDGKMVGYLDGIETRAYNIIVGKMVSAFINVPHVSGDEGNGVQTALEVIDSKPEIKVSYDGKAVIEISVTMNVVIGFEGDEKDIEDAGVRKKIEKAFDALIQNQLQTAIYKVQTEFQSDIFGFGKQLHMQHPEQWKKVSDRWDEVFSQADVHIQVQAKINETGEIIEPFLREDGPNE